MFKLLSITAFIVFTVFHLVIGFAVFPKTHIIANRTTQTSLKRIPEQKWLEFIQMGTDVFNKEKSLEGHILGAQVTVENGSISHKYLLESLPNAEAIEDNEVASIILKSSLYVYATQCKPNHIDDLQCEAFLDGKDLPENSELAQQCQKILRSRRDGHHPFRRLLPQNYKDGFYKMYTVDELPSPLLLSRMSMQDSDLKRKQELLDANRKSLSLVQWTQFVEHDLSKPVATSMNNGASIECCDKNSYTLRPRHQHPACAPLIANEPSYKYGPLTCLNYVRSALAVGSKCTFGVPEQLNQATGTLDLSQLYGFTDDANQRMRTHKNGLMKSTPATKLHQHLLPPADAAQFHDFCAFKIESNHSATCFMAGDSRVNMNPFAIVIYTIFLRNHNQIAHKLKSQHHNWTDEKLFTAAKELNIAIYRRILLDEWLPEVLGDKMAKDINKNYPSSGDNNRDYVDISNEFSVAMRFYFSMMPNSLHYFAMLQPTWHKESSSYAENNVMPEQDIFVLKDQIYNTNLTYTPEKLNDILEAILHQNAMKMDATYVDSLITDDLGNIRPTRADILASDIQRGRDHGIQSYTKYVRVCTGVEINNWHDMEQFIAKQDINKLKEVYNKVSAVDLIVGGISELPANGSVVGPTFACILAEQLAKIRQWHHAANSVMVESPELEDYKSITAADVLCFNSELKYVPKNIFQLASETNPLISCKERLETLRLRPEI